MSTNGTIFLRGSHFWGLNLICSLLNQGVFTKEYCTEPSELVMQNALIFATKSASYTVSKVGAVSPWLSEIS